MGANLILPAGSAAADSTPADPVTRSLRFNDGDNSGLYFDPTATYDSETVYTFSCWAKLGELSSSDTQNIFQAGYYSSSSNQKYVQFRILSNRKISVRLRNNSDNNSYDSTLLLRDPSAWYHLMLVRNGASLKVYVNNTEVISQTISATQMYGIGSSYPMHIGVSIKPTSSGVSNYYSFDGLLADAYFIDGEAKSPTDFIESNDYGGYKPKAYTGEFGTNGFHLKLDNSSDIGADDAGSNDFTPTNISSHDVMLDVPTKNYAVLNPLQKAGTNGSDPSEGNLSLTGGSNPSKAFSSTIAVNSGKYYAEFYIQSLGYPTVAVGDTSLWVDGYGSGRIQGNGVVAYDIRAASTNGQYFINSTSSSSNVGITPATDDIIQVAFDADTRKVWFGRNGTWNGSGDPANGTNHVGVVNGTDALAVLLRSESGTTVANYGQDPTFAGNKSSGQDTSQSEFYYAPPSSDFKSLNTSNLADPSVTPSENFAAKAYEGEGGGEEINLGFTPALTWIKRREDNDYWHGWYDSARGLSAGALASNSTNPEDSTERVASFDSDAGSEGFTLSPSLFSYTNTSGKDFISWNWKAHQTPPTPTSYSTTLTLTVDDDFGSGSTGWGDTELEVFEGTKSLGTVGQPTYDSVQGDAETVYEIKTNDASKIKIVWKTVDTSLDDYGSDRFYNIEVVLTDSSSNELASWYPSNYYGGGGYGPDAPEAGDVFRAQTSSADESTTGTLGVQQTTVEPNSEKYNAAAGFTMFTYTGNSSTNNDTMLFNHSLGVPIDFAIGKCRSTPSSGTSGGKWVVWHKDLSQDYYSLYLNETESENDVGSNNYDTVTYVSAGWFANASTGSQHHVKIRNVEIYDGSNTDTVRMVDNSKDFVFYGFAGVEGYSKFGKYTGNGVSDGPFVYTGFRPAFVLWKRATGSSNSWNIMDNKREGYNPQNDLLFPDSSTDESNVTDQDLLSNGFKLRTTGAGRNADNETFIYAAFAESPFKHANAR